VRRSGRQTCGNGRSGGAPFVAMMKATHFWNRHDDAIVGRRDRTRNQRVFVQRQVRAGSLMVRTIGGHQPLQARLVEHDHVIEALATRYSFRIAIRLHTRVDAPQPCWLDTPFHLSYLAWERLLEMSKSPPDMGVPALGGANRRGWQCAEPRASAWSHCVGRCLERPHAASGFLLLPRVASRHIGLFLAGCDPNQPSR
jgi:hypothetical protein